MFLGTTEQLCIKGGEIELIVMLGFSTAARDIDHRAFTPLLHFEGILNGKHKGQTSAKVQKRGLFTRPYAVGTRLLEKGAIQRNEVRFLLKPNSIHRQRTRYE